MKCPFQTVTVTNQVTVYKSVVTTEFAECLGSKCPYFGRRARRYNQCTQHDEVVIEPVCRRTEPAES